MSDGLKNARRDDSDKQRCQYQACRAMGRLGRRDQECEAITLVRRGRSLQNPDLSRNREFGERRNEFPPMRAPDDEFIARELAVKPNPRPGEPHKRMEPQDTQRNFIQQTNQVIAASGVRHLMNQHRVKFARIEQPIDPDRKQNTRMENSTHRGPEMSVAETHRNPIRLKSIPQAAIAKRGQRLRLATISAYARN